MNYTYFLLKLKRYNWHILTLYSALALLLSSNIALVFMLVRTQPVTIFVPTTTGEEFIFDGSFTPAYFERLATFLSQKIFSFYPEMPLNILPFLDPTKAPFLLKQREIWAEPYTRHHMQGLFYPRQVTLLGPQHVLVQGELKLFINNTLLRSIPLQSTLSFHVQNGQCFLSTWSSDTREKTQNA